MQTHWIPTHEYYRRLLAEPDPAARKALYIELFMQPWQAMMDQMAGMMPGGPSDDLAGARAWGWLLPDQLEPIQDLLARLEAAEAWETGRQALDESVARFAAYAERLPFEQVAGWLVLADPARADPLQRGYTGAVDWTQPRFVGQFSDPNPETLKRLDGLVAHEFHHLVRLNAFPWDMFKTSVADYIVLEGTAEAFAAARYGEDRVTFFVSEFDPAEFEVARRLIGQGLDRTGFNVIRGYMFGDVFAKQWGFEPVGGMPAYAGYAVGYQVVKAYLERSGKTIEEATFVPAAEIVQGSGFFA